MLGCHGEEMNLRGFCLRRPVLVRYSIHAAQQVVFLVEATIIKLSYAS